MSNYNTREKLQDNIAALRVVLTWDGISALSEEQIQVLKRYSGFGALKAILYKTDEDWAGASEADKRLRPLYNELYDLLESNLTAKEYKKIIESLRNSTLSAFYTPRVVPDTIYKVLSRYMNIEYLYEPSAGAGVYIESAMENLPGIQKIKAYEKDYMTARICSALYGADNCFIDNSPFEESLEAENGQYDLIISNIPFGAVPVYDRHINDRNLTGKLHNYFFAKGIEKIKDGGVLCYLTTNAFLDSPANRSARRYLFERCDLLSIVVMPDNLYKESAGTEAPSHLVVVRKNTGKTVLSEEEQELCESSMITVQGNTKVPRNNYVHECEIQGIDITIGQQKIGKNQYGKPAMETWWDGPIEDITGPLEEILTRDLDQRWIKDEEYEQEVEEESKAQEETVEQIADRLTGIFKTKDEWIKEHIIVGSIPKDNQELKDKGFEIQSLNRPIKYSDIPDKVKMFLPKHQQQVIVGSEEHWDILRNLENIIEQIPRPCGQDGVPADDKIVYLHYFHGGCDWYITERDEWGIQYQMFGYANLGDPICAEWGYMGTPEWENTPVELDLFWKPCRFGDIGKEDNDRCDTCNGTYEQCTCKEHYAPGDGNDIVWDSPKKVENRITLPDTCTVEPVKGTIIQVEDKLVQIEQVHGDGTVTVVDPGIKEGRDTQVMQQYLLIRDTLNQLETTENN